MDPPFLCTAGRIIRRMPLKTFAATFLLCVLAVAGVTTQTTFKEPPVTNEAWTRPFPGFRIVGNVYYVGTYDLASYLITTDQGHMLVNTGVGSSVPMIQANVESLGFRFGDIRLLLATHGHWDHVGGMAAIKRLTGARMLMHEADVPVLEDGGNSDAYREELPGPAAEGAPGVAVTNVRGVRLSWPERSRGQPDQRLLSDDLHDDLAPARARVELEEH